MSVNAALSLVIQLKWFEVPWLTRSRQTKCTMNKNIDEKFNILVLLEPNKRWVRINGG